MTADEIPQPTAPTQEQKKDSEEPKTPEQHAIDQGTLDDDQFKRLIASVGIGRKLVELASGLNDDTMTVCWEKKRTGFDEKSPNIIGIINGQDNIKLAVYQNGYYDTKSAPKIVDDRLTKILDSIYEDVTDIRDLGPLTGDYDEKHKPGWMKMGESLIAY
jgi:hypothetical protein